MKIEYDFSKANPNPYAKALTNKITIGLDQPTIEYFMQLSSETGVPYQSLISIYLRYCAVSKKKLDMEFAS